jgi:hypothetical protein
LSLITNNLLHFGAFTAYWKLATPGNQGRFTGKPADMMWMHARARLSVRGRTDERSRMGFAVWQPSALAYRAVGKQHLS